LNVILGGGDAGKTTILEAIALLLSPVNPTNLSDPDYHGRQIDLGFSIEGVLSLPLASGIGNKVKPSWPWEWTGDHVSIPNSEDDGKPTGEPVYRVRLTSLLALLTLLVANSSANFAVPCVIA